MTDITLGFAPVAAIVIICFLLGMGLKLSPLNDKWIPICVGVFGAALGLVAYFAIPSIMPSEDPFTACAIGIASGFASTGLHQAISQQTKNSTTSK